MSFVAEDAPPLKNGDMTTKAKVWYACYGSNLRRDRFYTYLRGGLPPDVAAGAIPQCGSRNPTLPANEGYATADNWLVTFRGQRSRWGEGGVAYLEPRQSDPVKRDISSRRPPAQLRLWLIALDQCVDVYLQENGIDPVSLTSEQIEAVERWLHRAVTTEGGQNKSLPEDADMPSKLLAGGYRRLVWLKDRHGVPVISFTSSDDEGAFSPPSRAYARTIGIGLWETFPDASVQSVADYLSDVTAMSDATALVAEAVDHYRSSCPS